MKKQMENYIGTAVVFSILMVVFGIAPIGRGKEETIAGIVILLIGNILYALAYFALQNFKKRKKK